MKFQAECSTHGIIAEAETKEALIMKILKARTQDQCWHVVHIKEVKEVEQ